MPAPRTADSSPALRRFGMTIIKSGGAGDGGESGGGGEGDAGEFAAEVGGVALAVLGVVQDGVDVVEDVPLVMEGSW